MKKPENMTDEELHEAIEKTKSVAEKLNDEERQRRILCYEELKRLRKQINLHT